MLGKFVQHIGCGGDGVRTQVKLQACFLGSGYEAVGRGLVARNVHIASGSLYFAFNLVSVRGGCVGVVPVVVSGADNLDIGFCNFGFLGEFLADKLFGYRQVAAEEPAYQSHCKHVAALQHGFVVHTRVGKAVFHHLGDRSGNDILFDAHFFNGVVRLESGLFQIRFLECVRIDDNTCGRFGKLILCF